jgi:hypothetical protein
MVLGFHQTTVGQNLAQVEAYRNGYTKAWEQAGFETARDMLIRNSGRDAQVVTLKSSQEILTEVLKDINNETLVAKPKGEIINEDFCKWIETYDGPPQFNFLHVDFPYGIDTEKRQQGTTIVRLGGYDDSIATHRHLRDTLLGSLDKICSPYAHIMFWFSMKYYDETLQALSKHFKIDEFPLIWHKSDGKSMIPDRNRLARRNYETCLYGSRGDRLIVGSIPNSFLHQTDTSIHPSTKPEPVLSNFFRMFVDQSTFMLDPTCGSGSSIRAAEALNAQRALGIEIDKKFYDEAVHLLEWERYEANKRLQSIGQPQTEVSEAAE